MDSSYTSSSTKPLYKGTQIVWYTIGLLEALLTFRFALKLLAANQSAGFTDFIYSITHLFVAPFNNVFRVTAVSNNIFEWTTLLAMLVYWLLALGIIRIFFMSKTISTPEAAAKLDNQENN
jgi:hypothetical protein